MGADRQGTRRLTPAKIGAATRRSSAPRSDIFGGTSIVSHCTTDAVRPNVGGAKPKKRRPLQENGLTTAERHGLVLDHQWIVGTYAPRYLRPGLSLEDLEQAAQVALCIAARYFDPSRGYKFDTYAVWRVRSKCLDEQRAGLIAVGKGRYSSDPDIQERVARCGHIWSLATIPGGDGTGWSYDPPEMSRDAGERREQLAMLSEAVDRLPPRLVRLMRLRSYEGQSLARIGCLMGVTKERLRQLEQTAHRLIRDDIGGLAGEAAR